jgi:hypothetical protein
MLTESASEAALSSVENNRQVFLIGRHRFGLDSPGFAEVIAAAHDVHLRPQCLCTGGGIEMYIARLAQHSGEAYIVKRMPGTGDQHATSCPSYEPPADLSGLAPLLGTAITEDPETGETTLKLGFSMAKIGGRATLPSPGTAGDSVTSDGSKLSLRGLLHYLWDQAELNRWRPGFAGKRTWATVRQRLLNAAEHKTARNVALKPRLFIPEPFFVDQRDAINARRLAQWGRAVAAPGKPQDLMLLIAEVKEIVPARFGFKAVIKHMPDQAFAIDEKLYRRLGRRFADELALWGATDTLHMVVITTLGIGASGVPAIEELSLMPVNGQWLPVEDGFELQEVDRLVAAGRGFIKVLRYGASGERPFPAIVMTDENTGGEHAPDQE